MPLQLNSRISPTDAAAARAFASLKPAFQSIVWTVAAGGGGDGDGGGGDGAGGGGDGGGGDGDGGGGDGSGGDGLGGGGDGGGGDSSETGQLRNVVMPLSLPSSGELVPDEAYASNCVVYPACVAAT